MGTFEQECERVALIVDPDGYHEKTWRDEHGAPLKKFVDEAVKAFADTGRLTLKVSEPVNHRVIGDLAVAGKPDEIIFQLQFRAENKVLDICPLPTDGSAHKPSAKSKAVSLKDYNEQWLRVALAEIMASVN